MKTLVTLAVIGFVVMFLVFFGPWMLGQPPKAEETKDIELNQTAFLVPLMGENKEEQEQVTSASALSQSKVIGKRITIPLRQKTTGRIAYEWVPSMALITVDRTPVMEIWKGNPFKGHEPAKTLALALQSKDGLKFAYPAVVSAVVVDEDAAVFQARYRGKSLPDIVNSDVRNFGQQSLSEKFAEVDLKEGRLKKMQFTAETEEAMRKYFKPFGITIDYFGLYEGLIFENRQVQAAIEAAYLNNLEAERLSHQINADNIRNITATETAEVDGQIAKIAEEVQEPLRLMRVIDLAKKQAKVIVDASQKSNGTVPTQVLPAGGQGNSVLMNVK